jgi:gliding motility-associated-like protein
VSCFGGSDGSLTVTGTGGIPPYEYSLSGGTYQATGDFVNLAAGAYTITIRDANLCTADFAAEINEPGPVEIEATTENTSCPDESDGSISITITGGTAPYTILWDDGGSGATRNDIPAGTYPVVVTDSRGCAGAETVTVGSNGGTGCLEMPTIITPNDDGFNDTWIIRNIDLFPNAELFIYNRWGELVFHTKNILENPWDGKSDGKLLPTDSYHYIIYLDGESKKRSGVISIIR